MNGVTCTVVETTRSYFAMGPDNVVNYDETHFFVGATGELVVEGKGKERTQVQDLNGMNLGSMFPFVSADGRVFFTLLDKKQRKRTKRMK